MPGWPATLHPLLLAALEKRGLGSPTPPQKEALGPILSGSHVLLVAPTGSGKTEAALVPLFHLLLAQGPQAGVRLLYLTPLRALNRDLLSRLEGLAEDVGLRVEVRHGDTPKGERRKQALHAPDVLVSTPETLQAMLLGRRLREHLARVEWIVVDEVHEVAGSKRGSQMAVALERLEAVRTEILGERPEARRIGLSATVGDPERVAQFLCGAGRRCRVVRVPLPKSMEIRVVAPEVGEEDARLAGELRCEPEVAAQVRTLRELVDRHRSVLMFVNTRQAAEALGARLRRLGSPVGVHHGSLAAQARVEAEEAFKKGDLRGLLCTSSLELGIDIGSVDLVVQVGSPRQAVRLVQRVGRSGHRLEGVSSGILLARDADDILESWVLARRARAGEVESPPIPLAPLDVAANQMCAMGLEGRGAEEMHALLRRAEPFREFPREEFEGVLALLSQVGLLGREGRRRPRTRDYVTGNLSMIPDEKKFEVYNLAERRVVGTLDESFVHRFCPPGAAFITRGDLWRVIEIEEGRVTVEPLETLEGEVPRWEGDEILVPGEVAREVGRLREAIARALREEKSEEDIRRALAGPYPVEAVPLRRVLEVFREQMDGGFPVATDTRWVAEAQGSTVTLNLCRGHRVNEALGRVLASLLSARSGSSVALRVDPCRIRMEVPPRASLREALDGLQPEHIPGLAERALRGTPLLHWALTHVARKFGVLSSEARLTDRRLEELFEGGPVHREALRVLLREKLDVEGAREALGELRRGEAEVVWGKPSPLGLLGFREGGELLSPERADRTILDTLRKRLERDRAMVVCLGCHEYTATKRVGHWEEKPACPRCGSRLLAALKPWEDAEARLARKGPKSDDERRAYRRLHRNASLVLSHGRRAILALSARGVGPETAARILRQTGDDDSLLRAIWTAERHYAATRAFWPSPPQGAGRFSTKPKGRAPSKTIK